MRHCPDCEKVRTKETTCQTCYYCTSCCVCPQPPVERDFSAWLNPKLSEYTQLIGYIGREITLDMCSKAARGGGYEVAELINRTVELCYSKLMNTVDKPTDRGGRLESS